MDRFGSFRVVGELGRGGMGIVYLGVQEGLGRPVAIKVLPHADDSLAARLRHEADVLADLQHPHIVSVLDVGEVDGRPYLVMPYFAGGTLGDVLRRDGALTPGQVTGVVAAVADALAAAHARGVLHRDVKPGNVLLSAQGDPYLADFGIATGSSQTKTSTGELLGTVGYVAPETIAGHPTSAAADVYALGVLAYTALTGRGPVVADNIMAALEAARTGRRVPLEEAAPSTPAALVSLVGAAMALDPADRPSDLRAYAQELRSAVPPQRITPMPDRATAVLAAEAPTSLGGRAAKVQRAEGDTLVGERRARTAVLVAAAAVALVALAATAVMAGALDRGGDRGGDKVGDGGGVALSTSPSPSPSPSPSVLPTASGTPTQKPSPSTTSSPPPPTPQPTPRPTPRPTPQPTPRPTPQPTPRPSPPPNQPPTLAAVSDRTADELTAVSIALSGRDPEDRPLTYSASGLPAGLRLSGNRISGSLSHTAASVTTDRRQGVRSRAFSVTATVRDDKGATARRSFTVTVRDTHRTMVNYIGRYGCGSSCGEPGPDVAALTTPSFSCHADGNASQPASTIWRQSIAPRTVIRWGTAVRYWYYEPSRTDCESVPGGW